MGKGQEKIGGGAEIEIRQVQADVSRIELSASQVDLVCVCVLNFDESGPSWLSVKLFEVNRP